MTLKSLLLALPCATLMLQACGDGTVETEHKNGQVYQRYQQIKNEQGELVKHGVYEAFDEKGVKRDSVNYDMGKLTGTELTWNAQGKVLTECSWLDNKHEGKCQEWDDNGILRKSVTSKQDIKHGPEITWNKKGIKLEETFYKDGKKDSTYQRWNDEGLLKQITQYSMGKLNGEEKIWCDDDKHKDVVREQRTFVMGKREGVETYYLCLDGSLSSILTWKEDKMDGPYTYWEEGKKIVETYKEGKCVKKCPEVPKPQ